MQTFLGYKRPGRARGHPQSCAHPACQRLRFGYGAHRGRAGGRGGHLQQSERLLAGGPRPAADHGRHGRLCGQSQRLRYGGHLAGLRELPDGSGGGGHPAAYLQTDGDLHHPAGGRHAQDHREGRARGPRHAAGGRAHPAGGLPPCPSSSWAPNAAAATPPAGWRPIRSSASFPTG